MADYTVVKRVRSPDGKSEFEFCYRTDGHYQYFGNSEITEDGITFWTPTAFSGLFNSQSLRSVMPLRMRVGFAKS